MPDEQNVVIIDEPEVNDNQEQVDALSPEELKMAENLKVKIDDKKEEVKTEVKEEKKEVVKVELKEDDYDSFEKVHDLYEHNKDLFYSLPKAIKNHYHNSKGLYKRAKDEEEKRKKIESDTGFNKLQESVSKARLERIRARVLEAKGDPELKGLTIEEIEELVDLQADNSQKTDDKPLTRRDLEELENKKLENARVEQEKEVERQRYVALKIQEADAYGKSNVSDITDGKYSNFDDVVVLAQEVIKLKPRYAKQLNEALNGESDEKEVVDVLVDIAKLNNKWGSSVKSEKVDVERMANNANKQKSSAALNGGKGGRVVSYDDLTPEDAARLSNDQWNKLPLDVRRRILKSV